MARRAVRIETAASLQIPTNGSRMPPGFRSFTSWTFGSPDDVLHR